MLLLLWILPLAIAQNPYGPSQLDQYARLFNSGNLGGFGLFQNAIAQGTIRGLGDLNPPPILAGLPPLPLTPEEALQKMTSTTAAPSTRATAKPTTPPTNPGGVYAINTLVELPPMPENRIHGTFDDDGVFHPDNEGKKEEDAQIVRNQIQGTKIRDFSQAERDTVEGHMEENTSKDEEYEEDISFEDPPKIRSTSNAGAHRLAQHNEKSRKPRQNHTTLRRQAIHVRQIRRQQQDPPRNINRGPRQSVVQQPRYPPFVFRPKPPPPQREPEYNNLLAEIEEYDDFLEQQRVYLSHYPKATLHNPYQNLPPGQLPAAGSYSAGALNAPVNIQHPVQQGIPPPTRNIDQGAQNFRPPPPQPQAPNPFWPQPPPPQNIFPPPFSPPGASTDNPLLTIFNLLSVAPQHPHALAAPQVSLDDPPTTTTKPTATGAPPPPLPRPNPYQLGMLPIPPSAMPLVDIHQQPLQPISFPQLGSPLVLQPLFHAGK